MTQPGPAYELSTIGNVIIGAPRRFRARLRCVLIVGSFWVLGSAFANGNEIRISAQPIISESQTVLVPRTLGILVNENDANSIELGNRYAEIRGIPSRNIIRLKLPNVNYVARHLMLRELERIKESPVYSELAGFVLAFDRPFRVDANQSITSAVSQGVSTMRWQGNCNPTADNPDAGKSAGAVMTLKPSMMLTAGGEFHDSLALAQRGRDADNLATVGQVVFWKTQDQARSVPREKSMERAERLYSKQIPVFVTETREPWRDLLGLQTGLAVVPNLDQFRFLPGAFADHLTSFGGVLDAKNSQTPATAWIKAGATASYGTVREPCNYPSKFPDPARLLSNYLSGDSLLEAYWKSVSTVIEGLFIGEPLARPFSLLDAELQGSQLVVRANRLTVAYLARQTRRAQIRGLRREMRLGFFWVESGRPEWIADVELPGPVNDGQVLLTLSLSLEGAASRQIGVLLRK